jgi:flagellar biosynthesis protein FliP
VVFVVFFASCGRPLSGLSIVFFRFFVSFFVMLVVSCRDFSVVLVILRGVLTSHRSPLADLSDVFFGFFLSFFVMWVVSCRILRQGTEFTERVEIRPSTSTSA